VTRAGRLSTCGRCGGTIERRPVAGWGHVTETARTAGHLPEPDDGWTAAETDDEDGEVRA
jgi:hypothetical protein